MGCNAAFDTRFDEDELPPHPVYVQSYVIDRHETTLSEYEECVYFGSCLVPWGGVDIMVIYGGAWSATESMLPVTCVEKVDAAYYCAWRGK